MVKRVRERDQRFQPRGGKGRAGAGGGDGKRKGAPGSDAKERAEFVKRRRQLGYDADAKLGLSAI